MDLNEVIDSAQGFVSLAAVIAFVLLLPLYVSQRRDLRRMKFWMEREPEHPGADLAASEAMLDRTETELEALIAEPEPAPGTTPVPAAERVASERPALTRITMERAALEPHPRWRRFAARATQPRILAALAALAVLLGVAAIFGSQELLSDDAGEGPSRVAAIDPGDVTVAVLNGTTVTGLAGKVGSDVESRGFGLGTVTNTDPGFERTAVLFAPGEKPAAQKVARDLGVDEVGEADRELLTVAG
ncbi:MAG: LytR C-terminal domain-containing protein, partial [Solirubrobacterales bacterium]